MTDYVVIAGAGTLRSTAPDAVAFPHRWTEEGVTVEASFTGAHLLHLAVAGCVLNDVYREAARLGIEVDGVRVAASGDFDTATWQSTGVGYQVEVDAAVAEAEIERLLDVVDGVAEIPKTLRAGVGAARVRVRR